MLCHRTSAEWFSGSADRPRGPGEETSSGNAGILSLSSIAPLASPELITRLLKLVTNLDTDFRLHYRHLPRLLPWIVRFLTRCNVKQYMEDGQLIDALTVPSVAAHRDLIGECKAQHLINQSGCLRLYRNLQSYRKDELERELFNLCQVNYSTLDRHEIHDLEPDLTDIFVRAILINDSISITNPESLCKYYAEYFRTLGGELKQSEVTQISQESNLWRIVTSDGIEHIERLLIALGASTPELI